MKNRTQNIVDSFYVNHEDLVYQKDNIQNIIEKLIFLIKSGGKILICGNGGSAADSDHIVGELMKSFRLKRPINMEYRNRLIELYGEDGTKIANGLQMGIPAFSLNQHSSLLSAIANDTDPSLVYAQQVSVVGNPNDILICLSTTGNSVNICNAAKVGSVKGMYTIGLTGSEESIINNLCSSTIKVPSNETYRTQEYHQVIYHYICMYIESELFEY